MYKGLTHFSFKNVDKTSIFFYYNSSRDSCSRLKYSQIYALCYLFFSDLREKAIGFICGCIHPYVIL